ncbi:MAG: redoxin domain-containing protein [bacterium]|nr:MAG: redoxin domain-containing protein [bacterium]
MSETRHLEIPHSLSALKHLLTAAAVILLSSVSAGALHGASDREIVEGDVIPAASLAAVDGSTVTIPTGDGLTVVLFWATWSPRSEPALELWQKFRDDYSGQPLSILTVNAEHDEITADDEAAIKAYITDKKVELPVVIDRGLELFNAYGVVAVPTAFFLDGEGKLLFRYPSLPTSASLDLKEELDVRLGLRERQTEEEKAHRGKLDYQPRNNALLYYNLGVQLQKRGQQDKAVQRYVMALQKDPDYPDPLRTLEGIYMRDGATPEAQQRLKDFLTENSLEALIPRIGQGEPIVVQGPEKIHARERMEKLLQQGAPQPAPAATPAQ